MQDIASAKPVPGIEPPVHLRGVVVSVASTEGAVDPHASLGRQMEPLEKTARDQYAATVKARAEQLQTQGGNHEHEPQRGQPGSDGPSAPGESRPPGTDTSGAEGKGGAPQGAGGAGEGTGRAAATEGRVAAVTEKTEGLGPKVLTGAKGVLGAAAEAGAKLAIPALVVVGSVEAQGAFSEQDAKRLTAGEITVAEFRKGLLEDGHSTRRMPDGSKAIPAESDIHQYVLKSLREQRTVSAPKDPTLRAAYDQQTEGLERRYIDTLLQQNSMQNATLPNGMHLMRKDGMLQESGLGNNGGEALARAVNGVVPLSGQVVRPALQAAGVQGVENSTFQNAMLASGRPEVQALLAKLPETADPTLAKSNPQLYALEQANAARILAEKMGGAGSEGSYTTLMFMLGKYSPEQVQAFTKELDARTAALDATKGVARTAALEVGPNGGLKNSQATPVADSQRQQSQTV